MVFVCLEIYPEICPAENILKNIWSPEICVRPTKIPGDHEILSTVHNVGLHVDFSSIKSSLGL